MPWRDCLPRGAITLATFPWISVLSFILASSANGNITSYRVPARGKLALCGYYTLTFQMWASGTSAYLYVTDTACSSLSATPCQPSANPALTPLSCMERTDCKGQTSQISSVPLCLIVHNRNVSSVLEVNVLVTGSLTPVAGSSSSSSDGSSSGSEGLSKFEIVLISVGSAAAIVIVAGLTSLTVWLLCCKAPPRPQPLDMPPAGPGDWGGKHFLMASSRDPHGMGPQGVPGGSQPLLSPATVYPYPPYGGLQYTMVPPGAPYGGIAAPFSPQGGVRSPSSSLAPLPTEAYYSSAFSAAHPQPPPSSTPPLLALPPLPPQRKGAAEVAAATAQSPMQPIQPPGQHEAQQQQQQQQGLQRVVSQSPAQPPPAPSQR